MGRFAITGKNISFDEPASYHKANTDFNAVVNNSASQCSRTQASSSDEKTYSKLHTQSSQSLGGTMPERNIGDQGMFGASNIEFRDSELRANTIPPKVQVKSATQQSSHSARLLSQAIRGEYRYAMLGLILGLATIIGGVILGLHGVVGSTSWTARLLGLESNLNDATPGVVLFIVGIFLVLLTRPKVNLDNLKG